MYTTVPMEADFFLASIITGVIVSFLYDILRISRRLTEPKRITVNVQDALFMVVAAVLLFVTAYLKNSGEVRWHGFLGFGCGVGSYALIVRNRVLNAGTFVVRWVIKIVGKALKILFFPITLLGRLFRKPARLIVWYTHRGISRVRSASRSSLGKMRLGVKNLGFMIRKK